MNIPCIVNFGTNRQSQLKPVQLVCSLIVMASLLPMTPARAESVAQLTAANISEWLGIDILQQGEALQTAIQQYNANNSCTANKNSANQSTSFNCTLIESNKTSPTELNAVINLDQNRISSVLISCNSPAVIASNQLNKLKQLYLNVLKQRDTLSFYEFNEEYRQRNNNAISEVGFRYTDKDVRAGFLFERSQCQISYQLIN